MIAPVLATQLLLPGSVQHLPVEPLVTRGRTPYATLQSQFDRAQTVSIHDLNGEYAGRCYFLDSPAKPIASLLVVGAIDKKSLGPIFDSPDYRRVTPVIAPESAPSVFDEVKYQTRKQARKLVERDGIHNAYPVQNGGSLLIEGMRTAVFQKRLYRIRKSSRYTILRMTCDEDTYCLNYRDGVPTNRVLNHSGETNAVCYYWP